MRETIQFLSVVFHSVFLKMPVFLCSKCSSQVRIHLSRSHFSLSSGSSPLPPSRASQSLVRTPTHPLSIPHFSGPRGRFCISCFLLLGFVVMRCVFQPFVCLLLSQFHDYYLSVKLSDEFIITMIVTSRESQASFLVVAGLVPKSFFPLAEGCFAVPGCSACGRNLAGDVAHSKPLSPFQVSVLRAKPCRGGCGQCYLFFAY